MKSGEKAQAVTGLNAVLPNAQLVRHFGSVQTLEEYGKTAITPGRNGPLMSSLT